MTLQDSFDPYSQWLDLPDGPRPPDHYTLLGINRSESDPAAVVHAADVQMARVRKIRPGEYIRDWGRLLDQIDTAKACLLDPASKTTYDVDLRAASAAGPTLEPTWTASAMKIAPPPPISPTETQTTTQTQNTAPTTVEPEQPLGMPIPTAKAAPAPIEQTTEHHVADSSAWSSPVQSRTTATTSRQPSSRTSCATALSSLYWFLLGGVLTAVVMLFVLRDRSPNPEPVVVDEPGQPSVVPAPPRVVPEQPKPPAEPLRVKPAPPVDPELPELPAEPPRVGPVQPPTESQIDAKKLSVFNQAVSDARRAMAGRDLSRAEDYLRKADENTQTVDDDNQLSRLETMLHNLREFWTGIREGVAGLESAGELPLGNTRIAIVEASRDRLIFRAAGRNHRYRIEQLPTVIVLAIADNWFKKGKPSTKVLIGTFLAVDPDGDHRRARRLWEAAIKQGVDIENLLPELDAK